MTTPEREKLLATAHPLTQEIAAMIGDLAVSEIAWIDGRVRATLPLLMGVQRREDYVRAMCHSTSEPCACADEKRTYEYPACKIVARHAAAVLALPHTGQPQEGQTRTFTFPADLKPKWIDRFMKDVQAHIRGIQDTSNETYPAPHHGWICFHCGERFTTKEGAAIHFGTFNDERPVCAAAPASPRAEGE